MGVFRLLLNFAVVAFSAVLAVAVPLIDSQTVLPPGLHPPALVELKKWYIAEYGDYLMLETPPFFLGLVWVEVILLWPLSIANIYGVIAGKRWASTTCLIFGVSTATSMAAMLGELLGAGRASNRLLQMFYPFVVMPFFAILRGLIPDSVRSSAYASKVSHVTKKTA